MEMEMGRRKSVRVRVKQGTLWDPWLLVGI
jgi:hypothetical protein